MKKWLWTSLILCLFGFLKELRPSEPFITEYLMDFKNITRDEIIHIAFPVSTYMSLATLVVVFLMTDFLRYRPVIIFEGLAYVITWVILIWGQDLTAIIFVEIFYGIACSTEVAYYTYMYAKVNKEHYKKVTSQTSSAILMGKFFSGVISQILISNSLMDYHGLNYLTLIAVSGAFLVSLFLPKASKSVYFNPIPSSESEELSETKSKYVLGYKMLWLDFKKSFSNTHILKWSVWYAVASAGQYQVINFIQALWERIHDDSHDEHLYNGAVKAIHTLLSAIFSFGVGYVNLSSLKHWSESLLCCISLLQGGLLVWMSLTNSLYQAYISYIIFRMIHPVMITIASAEVAVSIGDDSYGLVFGVLTFLALGIQTILTFVVSDARGLALNERNQFTVYGFYFGALGVLFFMVFVYNAVCILLKKVNSRANVKQTLTNSIEKCVDENETAEILKQGTK